MYLRVCGSVCVCVSELGNDDLRLTIFSPGRVFGRRRHYMVVSSLNRGRVLRASRKANRSEKTRWLSF